MPRMWRNLLIVMALAVGLFAAFSIYSDLGKLGDRLGRFQPLAVGAALLLALANYGIRWVRWELYLARTGIKAPRLATTLVFVSGFVMSVTPGKIGELFKAALLKETAGAPMERTVPIVIAERVTDLVSLVVLAVIGVALYGVALNLVLAGAGMVAIALVVISWRRLSYAVIDVIGRPRAMRPIAAKLRQIYDNLGWLVRTGPLAWATALAVVAWLAECVGFALIVRSFPGAYVSLGLAMLIYAATTVAGALSFLPGGLIVTEASMVLLLVHSAQGLDKPAAVAATILTRLCTLWFGVIIGLCAFAAVRRAFPAAPRTAEK